MIRIVKAKVHNLKSLTVNIPRRSLTVITGVSGSGKSSLAFDTIHAEGQRRYIESLSSYARQFLQQMEKPDVETISGLSPTIAIQQKSTSRNPRSTVGTITELYDYLRLLFAAIGEPHCPKCHKPVKSITPAQIVDELMRLPENTRLTVFAPIIRGRKGEFSKIFDELEKEGLSRIRIDGEIYNLDDDLPTLDRKKKHFIEVAIDRIRVSKKNEDMSPSRIHEAVELGFKLAEGQLIIAIKSCEGSDEVEKFYSESLMCPDCEISLPEIKPRLFSFNAPYGSCPVCSGLGVQLVVEPELVIPDASLSIKQGAIASENFTDTTFSRQWMEGLAQLYGFSLDTPFEKLNEKVKNVILYGSGNKVLNVKYKGRTMEGSLTKAFEGVIPTISRRYRETRSDGARRFYEKFMRTQNCPACNGRRLGPSALAVHINNESIYDMTTHSVSQLYNFFSNLKLSERNAFICKKVLEQICNRLKFLNNVGLDYLNLARAAHTLSGGEAQRIRLATQIGSALVGITYVLDEPSIGLHPRDNRRLINTLKHLRDIGNTVIVVEHDREIMMEADNIIDIGPGAGSEGGLLVVDGSPKKIIKTTKSLTGKFLSGKEFIGVPDKRRSGNRKHLKILGVEHNNLKNIDVDIPLGEFVVVTGVSGSGKSSLVSDTIFPLLNNTINKSHRAVGKFRDIRGVKYIDKVVNIDQNPIGRTPRSNPATYTGIFTPIRQLFSQTVEAKTRGYLPGRFSFNVKGGRCEVCEGSGQIQIEMHFLPDVYVTCEQCKGTRYNDETLKVKFKGKNIAEILAMTVTEALDFFEPFLSIKRKLQTLYDVGLGYITLGQASTTLSGGEAQRIKLSSELSKMATGSTFYLLDEPTTGLHFQDVRHLLEVLNRLVDKGNTVLVVEHNLDVIKSADYIIDLGPEGGDKGGYIIKSGTPEQVALTKESITGKFLCEEFERNKILTKNKIRKKSKKVTNGKN